MSEDDDRMDRARRIRRMREGDDDRSPDDGSNTPQEDGGETQSPEVTEGNGTDDSGDTDADSPGDETEMEWGAPGDAEADDGGQSASAADGDDERAVDASTDDGGPDEDASTDDGTSDADSPTGDDGAETDDAAAPKTTTASAGATAGGGTATQSAAGTASVAEEGSDAGSDDSDGLSAPLPDAEQLEGALEEAEADSEAETVTPDVGDAEADEGGEETRVLEFTLHDEHYCLDIEYIEEIVKQETITRVPNTPQFVEGVVDLRGQITTILNPKVTLDKADPIAGELIVVFDDDAFDDQGHVGWVVDDVRQVSLITEADVNDPPMDDDHINGVIDRGDEEEFVIWTTPNLVLDEAE